MTLLHTWPLYAGLAVALPLLIHWLTRPRPVRLALSTIRFVREAVQQKRARHRLRDIILLLLRATAILLLAAAFARPLIGAKPLVQTESSAGTARVVLLDQSLGMSEVSHGATAFDRARATAAKYLAYSPGAGANLILAGAKPRAVVERLTSNFGALRDELSSAHPLPQRLDPAPAINLASELLAAWPAGQRRELVIVSNFQRSNWASVDFSPLPKDTQIKLESVAPSPTPDNVGILKISTQGRVEQGREARIDVEIGNYSAAPREIEIQLSAGAITARLKGLCPAGVKTTLSTTIVPPQAGWQTGDCRLVGIDDALPGDNARSFVLNVRPSAVYALVTRESSAPRATSSHFIERALAPMKPRENGEMAHVERVKRMAPELVDRDSIGGADLIVLDHPGKLSTQTMNLLASLMRRGRPVLYVAAEPVDATNLKLLTQSAGADMKMPVEFVPAPAATTRHDLFMTEVKSNTAPFHAFGETLNAAIGPLRFGGGLASHPLPGALADDVLAGYDDHSACLVSTACGAGTLAVLNADLNDSNLVGSPVFVPLLEELVERLLSRHAGEGSVSCGEAFAAYLPSEAGAAAGLKVLTPPLGASNGPTGTISEDSNFVLWRWNAAGGPGVYSVQRDAATVFAIAAAAPGQVSDLTPLDPQLLKTRLAGERSVEVQVASDDSERRDNLWAWILVVCAGCLFVELLTLRIFKT